MAALNLGRVGEDLAGATITGPGATNVYVNGKKVVLFGDNVSGHGLSPHASPTMAGSSQTVFANSIAVCRAGDAATCSHALSPGSSNVFAG